ncbi:MAG TPA: hypothetical protein VFQ80_19525 [Thermomicrobiales bacterium]|jgi:hypothetical protein|nr:hypothetical protein [Thermomicrobiales bacterium]
MPRPFFALPLALALLGGSRPAVRAQDSAQPATLAAASGPAPVAWETTGGPGLPLDDPFQLAIDPAGNLRVAVDADGNAYIGEFGNDRIQKLRPLPPSSPGGAPAP